MRHLRWMIRFWAVALVASLGGVITQAEDGNWWAVMWAAFSLVGAGGALVAFYGWLRTRAPATDYYPPHANHP